MYYCPLSPLFALSLVILMIKFVLGFIVVPNKCIRYNISIVSNGGNGVRYAINHANAKAVFRPTESELLVADGVAHPYKKRDARKIR